MPELTTLGELASEIHSSDEAAAFKAIIAALDSNYPHGWREWPVHNYSFEELFGSEQVPTSIETKLRFAVPTVELARAFNPSASALSERSYRLIRSKLLKWPLGRALLYSPHNVMEKIHAPSYNIFMDTVAKLKHTFKKRTEASCELGRDVENSSEVSVPVQGGSDHLLATVLSQQMALFNKMIEMQVEQNNNVKLLLPHKPVAPESSDEVDMDRSFESIPDSTEYDEERQHSGSSKEAMLREKITNAQRQLAELQNIDGSEAIPIFDFTPSTTGQDPKIAKADPVAVKHGINCQKFRELDWRNIRYAETQKQFLASPAFSALKPNNLLAGITPEWRSNSILERTDHTLGAITYGLIQQRMVFQTLLESLPKEIQRKVGNDFATADSKFKKISDSLLQYVCGRRAEVIQNRREIYKPKNKALKNILNEIPPSETHLFEELAFSHAVKEQGGIYNFFPTKRRQNAPVRGSVAKSINKFPQTLQYRNKESRLPKKFDGRFKGKETTERRLQKFSTFNTQFGKKEGGKAGRK